MQTHEVSVPYVMEDFEEGDEVWRYNSKDKGFLFGVVYTTEGDTIFVSGDDGKLHTVSISEFGSKSKTGYGWGKLLDTSLIEIGSILSLRRGTVREFWKVEYFKQYRTGIPGKIRLCLEDNAFLESKKYTFANSYELSMILFAFEIEG